MNYHLSLDPRESAAIYARRHRHGRVRRATLLIGAAVAAVLLCVLMALEARAASDAPVRGQRYRVCRMVSIDPVTFVCRWKTAR